MRRRGLRGPPRHRLITILLDTGARRGDVAGLRVVDLDFDLGVALVLGKGRRERALPFGRTTAVALVATSRACFSRIAPGTWANDGPLETVVNRSASVACGPNVDQAAPRSQTSSTPVLAAADHDGWLCRA